MRSPFTLSFHDSSFSLSSSSPSLAPPLPLSLCLSLLLLSPPNLFSVPTPSYSSFSVRPSPPLVPTSLISLPLLTYFSLQSDLLAASSPGLRRLLEALSILANAQKSSLVPLNSSFNSSISMSNLIKDKDNNSISNGNSNISDLTGGGSWNFQDRVVVLAGLCEVRRKEE